LRPDAPDLIRSRPAPAFAVSGRDDFGSDVLEGMHLVHRTRASPEAHARIFGSLP